MCWVCRGRINGGTMTTVADSLAAGLREAGVEIVYGLPGGENVEVVDALRRAGIRLALVHHESSAVFMADAGARLTGTPGRAPVRPAGCASARRLHSGASAARVVAPAGDRGRARPGARASIRYAAPAGRSGRRAGDHDAEGQGRSAG